MAVSPFKRFGSGPGLRAPGRVAAFLLLAMLLSADARSAQPVALRNPSFEEGLTLAEGGYTSGDIPSWEDRVNATASSGVFNPGSPLAFAPDGSLVVYLDPGGFINQDLHLAGMSPATAQPSAEVRIDCQGRARTGGPAQVRFQLRTAAGVALLAQPVIAQIAPNATGYNALAATLTLPDAAALGANLGQAMTLHVDNPGASQINLDAFSASYAAPPRILSFAASPGRLSMPGGAATLAWSVTGATQLRLDGQPVAGGGTQVVPAVTTGYLLTAENADGASHARAVVVVDPAPALRISEFMASNLSAVPDGNGAFHDWVEIHNPGAQAVSTAGYTLTDDPANPAKWPFPDRLIPPGGHLLVFCSGQATPGYADNGNNPHTTFRLSDEGEYLGLFGPGGAVVHAFAPAFPPQVPNVSYGSALLPGAAPERLAGGEGAPVKTLVPPGDPGVWTAAAFDDTSWTTRTLPLEFSSASGPVYTAYSLPGGTTGNQNFGGSLGMDFDVVQGVTVSSLGCFDAGGNGIAGTITVQMWSRNNGGTPASSADDTAGTLLASATFTGTDGALQGAHRFKPVGPLALAPGSYTIVAYGYSAAELLYNRTPELTTDSGGGALAFVRSRYGTAGQWPVTVDGRVAQYGAGSFQFQAGVASGNLSAMLGQSASALMRTSFSFTNANPSALALTVSADDGFAAWLNGVEVARRNAPADLLYTSAATQADRATVRHDLTASLPLLPPGSNAVLAVQGLNLSAGDPDFLLSARLEVFSSSLQPAYFTAPTPGAANGPGVAQPGVVLHEIHYDPPDNASVPAEFVELYNPGPVAVDLGGYSFTRGVTYVFPPGTLIPPRGFRVVAQSPATVASLFGVSALGPWAGSLANDGETLELSDASGRRVDRVDYRVGFPWPTVSGPSHRSIGLMHPALDNELGGAWRAASPTPGQPNGGASDQPPPILRQVAHQALLAPTDPSGCVRPGSDVLVTARITDADGVASAELEYQVVEPGDYLRLGDTAFLSRWTPLPLRDDGTQGDAQAFDATYTGVIPGAVHQHRRLIRYRLRALDGRGAAVTVPLASEPCPNFAYFCYAGVPAWTAAVQPGTTAASTFPTNTLRKARAWHLLSRADDVYNCQYNSAYNDGVFHFEGALVADGRVYDHVHYRVKGQNSTYNTGKNKWKFKFNPGDLLRLPADRGADTTLVETLNMSSVPASWAPWNRGLAGLDEALQYRLTQLAGVDAPRNAFLQWRVVDDAAEATASQYEGDFWGLYLAFENQDGRFKDAHGLPDGNIFRLQATANNNHLLDQGAGQPGDLSDLNAFTSAVTGYQAPGQTEAWFRANVDLHRYFSWRAVNEAVNNTDIREQENVVYFRDPSSGRWHVQPWDCDLLYEQLDRWGPQGTQTTAAYEQIRRALNHPAIRVEFQNRARELQDLLLNSDQAWKLADEIVCAITDEAPALLANGGPVNPGLVEADRRRWDYWPQNPVPPRATGAFGNYYRTPYPIPNMGLGPPQPFYRTLATADFAGQVKWVKDFIAADPRGGGRLAQMAAGQVDPVTLAATGASAVIPDTPVLSDLSGPGHPSNRLRFQTSAFSSPNGKSFAALQWRIARCAWPGLAGFDPAQPWRYEVQSAWESGDLTAFNAVVDIPPQFIATGAVYRVRARMKDADGHRSHWSAPVEFTPGPAATGALAASLVISEIMYQPPGGGDAEYIELLNISPTDPLDLTGVAFTRGVSFAFPAGTLLAPTGRVLVVRNAAAFSAVHGAGLPVAGVYAGALDNGGERLTLSLGLNQTLRDMTYDDAFPWPEGADGRGASLVLIAPHANPDHADPLNWRASVAPNPGSTDTVPDAPYADTHRLEFLALAPDGSHFVTAYRALGAGFAPILIEVSTNLVDWVAPPSALLRARSSTNGIEALRYELPAWIPPSQRGYARVRYLAP